MGMSTHVVGFRQADEKWEQMKAVWDACEDAGVEPPDDVSDFFEHESPGDKPGMEVNIKAAVEPYREDMRDGFDVDVTKLPEGVKIVRFYNGY